MTAFILSECETDEPVEVSCAQADIWAYTRGAPDKATGNEDAAAVLGGEEPPLVLAVADGLGGMPAGSAASEIALDALQQKLAGADPEQPIRAAIMDAFEEANQQILDMGTGAGTTLAVAELDAGHLRTYHVGDSAVVVVGQRGRVKLETMAHSPVGYGVAAGLIDPEAALTHDDRHFVSNHLGAADMRIEVGSRIPLAERDTVLLASDGLFDNMHAAEIVDRIRKGPLEAAARGLAETCTARMAAQDADAPAKPDDVTFILMRAGRPSRASHAAPPEETR